MKTILYLFLGIVLIVAGTAVLTYQGVTLTTAERQFLNFGPLTAGTHEFNRTITLPPLLGGILLAAGMVLVFIIAVVKRSPRHEKHLKLPSGSGLAAPNMK
ncbi:MAG: DUF3185 domain-containing protein [Acidobacteria bacterium]|nr:DUF3185 domain-containing protein [Acidobacteriota bacterium]